MRSRSEDGVDFSTREPLSRLARGLPATWYHDPVQYQRELEAFWYSRWIVAGRDEDVPAPGDWRVVRVGNQAIVLVRGDDGTLRAFHNTCRHRGSILCTGDQGHFARSRIVCPYHSWTYDLAGRLIATPRQMRTPDFATDDFPLFPVAVESWGGFVFVNFAGASAGPLAPVIGSRTQRYAHYEFERLRVGKRIVVDVQANWKLLAENFAECFHCPPVHPELCRIVTAYRDAGAWGLHRDAQGGVVTETRPEYRPGVCTLTLDGSARLPPLRNLDARERETIYIADMVLPNLFLNVQPDYVNAHTMFPTGAQSVRIVYDWLFEPEHLPLADDDLQHYVALWEITNRQDARNCEWQQQGIRCREFRHGVFVPQEFDCVRFVDWVRAGLRRRASPTRPANARGKSER